MLDGKSIQLREMRIHDVPIWYSWFNDLEITQFMNKGQFPNTEMSQEDFYRKLTQSKTDVQFAIVDLQSEELIGIVGIHEISPIHRTGKISILVGNKKFWGRGAASEAIGMVVRHGFLKLNLNKLYAGVWDGNTGCVRAFEHNGFVREGRLSQQFFCQGRYVDEIFVGLLRDMWKQN